MTFGCLLDDVCMKMTLRDHNFHVKTQIEDEFNWYIPIQVRMDWCLVLLDSFVTQCAICYFLADFFCNWLWNDFKTTFDFEWFYQTLGFGMTLGRLWYDFGMTLWDHFAGWLCEMTLRWLLDDFVRLLCEMTVRWLWDDYCETLWDDFEMTLG